MLKCHHRVPQPCRTEAQGSLPRRRGAYQPWANRTDRVPWHHRFRACNTSRAALHQKPSTFRSGSLRALSSGPAARADAGSAEGVARSMPPGGFGGGRIVQMRSSIHDELDRSQGRRSPSTLTHTHTLSLTLTLTPTLTLILPLTPYSDPNPDPLH